MCIIFKKRNGGESEGTLEGEQDLSATGALRAVFGGCNFSRVLTDGMGKRHGRTCAFYYSSRIVTLILISRSKTLIFRVRCS